LKSIFLLVYHQNPKVLKERSIEKRERKSIGKKEEGKRNFLRASPNKKGKSIF
jgi:hypothetical protein